MPRIPDWYARLYTTEERLERAEGALEAVWNKLASLGWEYHLGPANWIEQALAWIEERVESLKAIRTTRAALLARWADYVRQLEAESPRRMEPDYWGWCNLCDRLVPTARPGAPCPVCLTILVNNPGTHATERPSGIGDVEVEPVDVPAQVRQAGEVGVANGRADEYATEASKVQARSFPDRPWLYGLLRHAFLAGWDGRRESYGYDEKAVAELLSHVDACPFDLSPANHLSETREAWLRRLNDLAKAARK